MSSLIRSDPESQERLKLASNFTHQVRPRIPGKIEACKQLAKYWNSGSLKEISLSRNTLQNNSFPNLLRSSEQTGRFL